MRVAFRLSDMPRAHFVEYAEMPLTSLRHIRNVDRAAHVARPRFFRQRLHGGKIPELPFRHDDFRHAVFQHPILKRGKAGWFAIGEHGVGYGFSHAHVSLVGRRYAFASPRIARLKRMNPSKARAVRIEAGA